MLVILFLTFFILLLINMPIAFALGIATAVTLLSDPVLPINSIVTRAFVGVDSFTLLAIPFFIIAGELMNACVAGLRMCPSYRACSLPESPDRPLPTHRRWVR